MNAGFSNLATLKKQLLANSIKTDLRFDDIISQIGQGTASMFERLCNRPLGYMAGEVETFRADYCEFVLRRTPVYAVTAWQVKHTEAKGWQPRDISWIRSIDLANGIVNPSDHDVGPWFAQVQFTYNGGYFWEQLEPKDPGYPSAVPAGVHALPADLLNAWFLQCRHVWAYLDKLGTDLLTAGKATSIRFPEDFAPTVETVIANHRRYKLV
ncbi:hypothetical protein [Silvimonas sp.]|uniref:hypothetical protein n=1 Tax=Silvimonas sp. TaxID=2650811 RepID=UPI002846D241|nr:hypothetical protein [Silvimonas sp.]MDR3427851.1 hypothetical protein [Silvimonas sp.]